MCAYRNLYFVPNTYYKVNPNKLPKKSGPMCTFKYTLFFDSWIHLNRGCIQHIIQCSLQCLSCLSLFQYQYQYDKLQKTALHTVQYRIWQWWEVGEGVFLCCLHVSHKICFWHNRRGETFKVRCYSEEQTSQCWGDKSTKFWALYVDILFEPLFYI